MTMPRLGLGIVSFYVALGPGGTGGFNAARPDYGATSIYRVLYQVDEIFDEKPRKMVDSAGGVM